MVGDGSEYCALPVSIRELDQNVCNSASNRAKCRSLSVHHAFTAELLRCLLGAAGRVELLLVIHGVVVGGVVFRMQSAAPLSFPGVHH